MIYTFRCYEHDEFTLEASIKDGPPEIVYCPTCHEESIRVFDGGQNIIWKTNGAHGRAGHYLGDFQGNKSKEDILRSSIEGGKNLTVPKDVT